MGDFHVFPFYAVCFSDNCVLTNYTIKSYKSYFCFKKNIYITQFLQSFLVGHAHLWPPLRHWPWCSDTLISAGSIWPNGLLICASQHDSLLKTAPVTLTDQEEKHQVKEDSALDTGLNFPLPGGLVTNTARTLVLLCHPHNWPCGCHDWFLKSWPGKR